MCHFAPSSVQALCMTAPELIGQLSMNDHVPTSTFVRDLHAVTCAGCVYYEGVSDAHRLADDSVAETSTLH